MMFFKILIYKISLMFLLIVCDSEVVQDFSKERKARHLHLSSNKSVYFSKCR
ncbi:hypothetical protein KY290_020950 [Solanum tuberosum]|uniref:Lipoprotein n=1 Tax=Solanum tuberosum TaxID=4113 RepID=A0ABQ7V045_SOLTU|nr:hypothetical protein KY289_020112 [Solanum tuberosum]KAH0757457.1 hypothetical protein KY290_020950 [Solanum tuberosum]